MGRREGENGSKTCHRQERSTCCPQADLGEEAEWEDAGTQRSVASQTSAGQGETHMFMYRMVGIKTKAYPTSLEKSNSWARAPPQTTRSKAFINDLLGEARLGVTAAQLERGHSTRED